jgi:hypothetical protein
MLPKLNSKMDRDCVEHHPEVPASGSIPSHDLTAKTEFRERWGLASRIFACCLFYLTLRHQKFRAGSLHAVTLGSDQRP